MMLFMKHRFHSKDGSFWSVWCPCKRQSFSTKVWQAGVRNQYCPLCDYGVHEELPDDAVLLTKNIKRFGSKTDTDTLKYQKTLDDRYA